MQQLPFSQVQQTPTKQAIQAISGTINQVFPRENKIGNYGPFTVQKIMIQEPGTGLILRVSIFDADDFKPSHIGQTFGAALGQNSKGQWVGLAADHYQSQTQGMIFGIKCGKGGALFLNGQPWSSGVAIAPVQPQLTQQNFVPQAPNPQWAPPPQVAPQQFVPQTGTVPQTGNFPQQLTLQPSSKSPLAFLTGQSAAYVMCFEAALRVREQLLPQLELGPGEPLTTTDVKDMATTFYIEGNRKGIFNNVVCNASNEADEGL